MVRLMSYPAALAAAVAFSMSSQAAPLHYRFLSHNEIDSDNRYPSRYHGPFYHLAPDDDIREPEVFRYFRRMEGSPYQKMQAIEMFQSPGSSSINDQDPTKPTSVKRPGIVQQVAKHAVWAKNTASGHWKTVAGRVKTLSSALAGPVSTVRRYFKTPSATRKSAERQQMRDPTSEVRR